MSVDKSGMSAKPNHPTVPRALVERIVCAAQDRSQAAFARTHTMRDDFARFDRLAVLWHREARWWRVLLRYVDPKSPYLWAVVQAYNAARRYSLTYQDAADRAALRRRLGDPEPVPDIPE